MAIYVSPTGCQWYMDDKLPPSFVLQLKPSQVAEILKAARCKVAFYAETKNMYFVIVTDIILFSSLCKIHVAFHI